MKSHLVSAFGFVGCTGLRVFGGCGPAGGPLPVVEVTGTESNVPSVDVPHYFTARRDPRACAGPSCGGYFVKEVNVGAPERYVSGLDFSQAGFDDDTARVVREAPDGELVLRGSIGGAAQWFREAPFVVVDAFRGMPGIVQDGGDAFYVARVRDRGTPCLSSNCDDEVAYELNTAVTADFDGISVVRAAAPFVDPAWLSGRVLHHGAVVAAHFRRGPARDTAGPPEPMLDVGQVFVKLPDRAGPCLLPHHVCLGSLTPTYKRDADRCLVFETCVDPARCHGEGILFPRCAEGYSAVTWAADTRTCVALACDPAFLAQ